MDFPDQQALIAEFIAGLARESDADFKGLSQLLATLPEPSQSRQEAMSVSEARVSYQKLQMRHFTLLATLK